MKEIAMLGWHPMYGEVILEVLKETFGAVEIALFLNIEIPNKEPFNIPADILTIHPPAGSGLADRPCCFGTAGPWNKQLIFEDFMRSHGWQTNDYLRVIHPSSYVAGSATIQPGCLIEPMCTISTATHIGFGTTIKRGSHIGHHNRIGAWCDINPGVILSGDCLIGDGTTLGSGTVVRDGVNIGKGCFIGMGSVVTKDIPDGMMAFGNPCKVQKPFQKEHLEQL
jgi:sugar O-acyltransferase (sialic acid O-acetyltransferase NeuD family)